MKYKVIKFLSKRSENFKPYNVGSEIELTDKEAKVLMEGGFVAKENKAPRKTKEEKQSKTTK